MKTYRLGAAVAAALVLSGCTHFHAPISTAPAIVQSKDASDDAISDILENARSLQAQYESGYNKSNRYSDYGNLPLILSAAASAAVLLAGGGNAADVTGYIGIGATAYAASRSSIFPQKMPDLFLQGHSALACVRQEGYLFVGDTAVNLKKRFDGAIEQSPGSSSSGLVENLKNARGTYEATFPAKSGTITDDKYAALSKEYLAEKTKLEQAITAALPILSAARLQQSSFDTATVVFASSVSAISTKVATKAREGRAVDFDALLASFPKPTAPEPADKSGQNISSHDPYQDAVDKVKAQTREVNDSADFLKTITPKYDGALSRVSKCPNSIS